MELVIPISKASNSHKVGRKASSLWYLRRIGMRIPETYVCTFAMYENYLQNREKMASILREQLCKVVNGQKKYSVRSSANVEDESAHSFAGQFKTNLNTVSVDDISEAVVSVWDSCRDERAHSYLQRIGVNTIDLRMAVIIQEMVDSKLSGIAFTRNPVTGMDESIIEYVHGLGDALVQSGITPARWVYKWGSWIETPAQKEDEELMQVVLLEAKKIERKYGKPVDLEWTYDGQDLYWLQLREITTVKGINIYSNRISKEFLPGIIKPLIWSVNIPVVNRSWKQLLIELVGKSARNIDINSLAKSFYYRSYFNMGIIGDIFELIGMPRESIELLMGVKVTGGKRPKMKPGVRVMRYMPRLLLFAASKMLFSRKIMKFLTLKSKIYDEYGNKDTNSLDEKKTMLCIEHLLEINTQSSYFVIVTQLLMGFYNMLMKSVLARFGVDISAVSFEDGKELLQDIDANYHLSILRSRYEAYSEKIRDAIRTTKYDKLSGVPGLENFQEGMDNFLSKFGHLSDSGNDFSHITWKEMPDYVLHMIIDFKNPETKSDNLLDIGSFAVSPVVRLFLSLLYKKALEYRVYREKVNFIYTFGYGMFRPYFLHLANLFNSKEYIAEQDDIFYLTLDEIREIVEYGFMPGELMELYMKRKEEVAKYRDLELPGLIVGDSDPIPLHKSQIAKILKGIPASGGYIEGLVKVVRGIMDFKKVEDGDILTIPYSDVSWTPLFSKAKAIIAESGGILSHCSIVAREYGIPAVVSVQGCLDLDDGTEVVVNGHVGEVTVRRQKKVE
jgi:phosphohistidine swiveling domain-containing protein